MTDCECVGWFLCVCEGERERVGGERERERVEEKYSGEADRSEIAPQHQCGSASVWLPYRFRAAG